VSRSGSVLKAESRTVVVSGRHRVGFTYFVFGAARRAEPPQISWWLDYFGKVFQQNASADNNPVTLLTDKLENKLPSIRPTVLPFLLAYNFVPCPCSRSDIMPP